MKENVDFRLVPDEAGDDDRGNWHVQIMTGEFNECVIKFGKVTPNPNTRSNQFSFEVLKAIDPDNDVVENPRLQKVAGDILTDLIPATSFNPIKTTMNAVKHIFGKSGKLGSGG